VSSARNFGISISKNEIIKFIDADDMLAPFALDKIRDTFTEGILVCRQMKYIDKNLADISQNFINVNQIKATIIHYNPFLVNNCVISKSLLDEFGGFDEEIEFEEDYDLWLRIYKKYGLDKFYLSNDIIGIYNIDRKLREEIIRSHTKNGIDVREYFRNEYGISTIQ
jgi:glycosyltransferase involved in cell wall biosynthesis